MHPVLVFLISVVVLPSIFWVTIKSFPAYFAPTKRRMGVMSMIASATMTILSLPYVAEFIQAGGNVSLMDERRDRDHGWYGLEGSGRKALGEVVCMTFASYLVCDLLVGRKYYRNDLTVVNGYIHHHVYAFIVVGAVATWQTSLFAVCALMELPTFFLALANTFPKQRNDWAFASTFLATRICLHAWICWAYGVWVTEGFRVGRTETGIWELDTGKRRYQQWAGVFFIFLAFPLHVNWFKNNVAGMLRRSRQAAALSPSPPSSAALHPSPPLLPSRARSTQLRPSSSALSVSDSGSLSSSRSSSPSADEADGSTTPLFEDLLGGVAPVSLKL